LIFSGRNNRNIHVDTICWTDDALDRSFVEASWLCSSGSDLYSSVTARLCTSALQSRRSAPGVHRNSSR